MGTAFIVFVIAITLFKVLSFAKEEKEGLKHMVENPKENWKEFMEYYHEEKERQQK